MFRVLTILVFTVVPLRAEAVAGAPADPSAAVVRLLELLTAGEDSVAFRTAVRQLANKRPPTEALVDDAKLPATRAGSEELNVAARTALGDLGQYIALHPAEFPNGLPDIGDLRRQRQLGPLFEGMLPGGWQSKQYAGRLETLDPIIGGTWLEAAARCGAFDFHHLVRMRRGQLRNMLASYQESGDEIGIIRLGEAIARHSAPVSGIDPRVLSTRTLALLLSGASGVHNSGLAERSDLVHAALGWRRSHPDLVNALAGLRGECSSLRMLEAGDLWHRGERTTALKLLFSRTDVAPWAMASFVNSLLLSADPPDEEASALARLIPTEVLVSCARQLLEGDPPDDRHAKLGCQMVPEFHSRTDRTREHWIPFSMDIARKTALRAWMDGRNDDAHRLLRESFFNLNSSEHSGDMLRFAAIARAFGKEASVMDDLERRAAMPGYSDLAQHKAALLTVAGKHREALDLARTRPPGDLFHRLLIECGEWDALRESAFGPAPRSKEKHQGLCHAAFLNQPPAAARAYFNSLPKDAKENTALLLLLSGNDELCRKHARGLIAKELGYSELPFPISLNAFEIWERSILDDLDAAQPPWSETVLNFTTHAGMTRDRAATIRILDRLTRTGRLRTKSDGPYGRDFTEQLDWQHRFRAAGCLIDLGAVDQGCAALEKMAEEDPDRLGQLRFEYWAAFVPPRFNTNGFGEYLRIAELELPAASKLDHHRFLAKILAENPTPEAVRRMLGLLEKHRAGIPFKDASLLIQKLSIALWGEPPAPELRSQAERVLAFYQPNARQLEFFQRWARPAPWEDRFSRRAEIEEKPGDRHDPRSAGFRVLDGMGRIRSLLAEHRTNEAAGLFREMEIRMLLDELPHEKFSVITRTNQESSGISGDHCPEAIPVIAAYCWNLQTPFLQNYALTVWRCDMDINPRFLAPLLARNGDFREARIAAIEYQVGWGNNEIKIIRMLPAIDGLAHAGEGRVDEALDRLDVCMNLSPFDPTPGMAILNAFQQRGDRPAVERTAARIRDYWKQRLAEYPHSPHVRKAGHYWLGELDRCL